MLFTGFAWSDKTLSWLAVAGADGYDVWVIKDEVQKGSVRNTSAASIDLTSDIESYGDGTYYVRVMAYKLESGNYLAEGSSPVKIIDTTPTYSVTINAGANMTLASGNANQSGLSGAMTDTVYTAADGYYFPTGYSVAAVNGITVTRNSYTQITVSGTPAANTTITLTSATAKTKETTPTATFDAQGTDFGNLLNWPTGMKYSVDGGITWTENTSSYNYKAIYDVSADRDIKVYMPASDPTKLDSDI